MCVCVCVCVSSWSCPTLCDLVDCSSPGSSVQGILTRQEYWSVLPFSFPGNLLNPGMQPSLLHCRQTFYYLSHQDSSQSRDGTRVSHIADRLFPTEAPVLWIRKCLKKKKRKGRVHTNLGQTLSHLNH